MSSHYVVADACFMLNFAATGRDAQLLQALDITLLMAAAVREEVLYLSSPPDEEGHSTREQVDLSHLEKRSLLITIPPEDVPAELFVAAAAHLRDRDAVSLALAAARGLPLCTDDARVRKVAGQVFPAVELVSTLHILKEAFEALGLGAELERAILVAVRQRAHFAPPRKDPLREWYFSITP